MSGIYGIRNIVNNNIYIGSTVYFPRRKSTHFCDLGKNSHFNAHLQSAFNKYGAENFCFEILIRCEKENLIFWEQHFIDKYNPEYNICKIAGNCLGVKRSPESIAKGIKSRGKIIVSEETRRKMSLGNRGVSQKTRDARKKHKMATGKDHPNSKPVRQLTLSGEFIKRYDAAREGARATNSLPTSIYKVLRGKINQTNGFKWEYEV